MLLQFAARAVLYWVALRALAAGMLSISPSSSSGGGASLGAHLVSGLPLRAVLFLVALVPVLVLLDIWRAGENILFADVGVGARHIAGVALSAAIGLEILLSLAVGSP